ncbi:hypothetical protein Cgig2_022644 [Carnegiea gigantea]|uniref:Uncharacterized protein n=1 Tax=Carnegiea gigantea TaxID=171969 RepID=A0A9Q1JF03_9CARY|nr:hypothetical protein Cgig2_022644 [Carnegiea gigantea]
MWACQEQRTVSNQNPTIPEPSSQIPVIPNSLPAPAMSAAEEQDSSTANSRRHLSCMPCFDALWFCYCSPLSLSLSLSLSHAQLDTTPVHQLQQYYRLGALDNCSKKWSDLLYCLNLKTKSSSEVQEILEAREKAKPHIWSFRTCEESAAQWQKWYEHLDKPE